MKRSRLQWDTERRRRTRRMMDEAKVELVRRSGGWCESNRFSQHCTKVGQDPHHIRPADRDENRHEAARMAWLCRNCHTLAPDAVHRDIERARAAGLLKNSWEDFD